MLERRAREFGMLAPSIKMLEAIASGCLGLSILRGLPQKTIGFSTPMGTTSIEDATVRERTRPMANGQLGTVLRHIRRLAVSQSTKDLSDGQLLQRFVVGHDQAAFAALVQRYGRLVWSVCRHVLHHEQDAEDAFQATFLVLAKKAKSIRKSEAIASWLHGVAYRVAMKAKRDAARRRTRERKTRPLSPTLPETSLLELQAVLDDEVRRLPEKYRAPFVLCCLDGKSTAEAAEQLRWKVGTVSGRLSLARKQLQRRLTRRGLALSAALCALGISRTAAASSVPAGLANVTARAALAFTGGKTAAGVVSAEVAALVQGVTKTMMLTHLKIATAAFLALTAGLAGAGLLTRQALAEKTAAPSSAALKEVPKGVVAAKEKPKPAEAKQETTGPVVFGGRVLDPDGKPFAGAKLYLLSHAAQAMPKKAQAISTSEGRFGFNVAEADVTLPAAIVDDPWNYVFLVAI